MTIIQELTKQQLSTVLRLATIRGRVDTGMLADFLAETDWSGSDSELSPMARYVGQLQSIVGDWSCDVQAWDETDYYLAVLELHRELLGAHDTQVEVIIPNDAPFTYTGTADALS